MRSPLNRVQMGLAKSALVLLLGGCKRAPDCPPCPSCKAVAQVSAAPTPASAAPTPAMPTWASLISGKSLTYSTTYPGDGAIAGSLTFNEPRILPASNERWADWVVFDLTFATDAGDPADRWVEAVSAAHGEERPCRFDRLNPFTGLPKAGHKVTVTLSCPDVSDVDELDFRNGAPVVLELTGGNWTARPNPNSAPAP